MNYLIEQLEVIAICVVVVAAWVVMVIGRSEG